MASPIRRLVENPEAIVGHLVAPGMTVLDVGSAMGFFSLPLARMVGPDARVLCLDVQERMLSALRRRARRRGLETVIETRVCSQESLGVEDLEGDAGLVIAVHMLHESRNQDGVLAECFAALAPGGRLLIIEPRGHVTEDQFASTCTAAGACGLIEVEHSQSRKSFRAVFEKST